jgi:hypothetical protein
LVAVGVVAVAVAIALLLLVPDTAPPTQNTTSMSPNSGKPAASTAAGKSTADVPAAGANSPASDTFAADLASAASSADASALAAPPAAAPADSTSTPPAPAAPASAPVRITASNVIRTPDQDLADEPWKIREERRELSESFLNIGNRVRSGEPAPAEVEFPLFDGKSVTLTDFEYHPQSLPNEGVFFAKVKGDVSGNHVLFSYVNNALVGAIHVPSLDLFFDIRNATAQGGAASEIFLAQLNPAKMPVCGTCRPAANGGTAGTVGGAGGAGTGGGAGVINPANPATPHAH